MKKILWSIPFIFFLVSLVLGATPWAKSVDFALWPFRFALILGLSVLVLRTRWRHRHDTPGKRTPPDAFDKMFYSCRNWWYGESDHSSPQSDERQTKWPHSTPSYRSAGQLQVTLKS